MTDTTPILQLPLIHAAQAQKHVTHNESLNMLDVLVQLSVLDDSLSAPPANPNLGDAYIVASAGSAAWADADHQIAVFEGGGWMLYQPRIGWIAYVQSRGGLVNYSSTGWTAVTAAAAELPQTVEQWGINAAADGVNRLAVASANTLFSHEGTSHRLKINKASTADTASLMFQTNWFGRAEMGLAGEDAFSIKVKPDGQAWTTALRVDPISGALRAPSGGVRETTLSAMIYHVAPTGDDSANGDQTAPLATIQEALDRIGTLDAQSQTAEIRLTDGVHVLAADLNWPSAVPGLKAIKLCGASGIAANVTLDLGAYGLTFDEGVFQLSDISMTGAATSGAAISVHAGAKLSVNNLLFSNPGEACILADGGWVRLHSMRFSGTAGSLLHARARGCIDARNLGLSVDPSADFSTAALMASLGGIIDLAGSNLPTDGTGKSYDVTGNAVINAAGTGFPGDAAGTTATGGVVV